MIKITVKLVEGCLEQQSERGAIANDWREATFILRDWERAKRYPAPLEPDIKEIKTESGAQRYFDYHAPQKVLDAVRSGKMVVAVPHRTEDVVCFTPETEDDWRQIAEAARECWHDEFHWNIQFHPDFQPAPQS